MLARFSISSFAFPASPKCLRKSYVSLIFQVGGEKVVTAKSNEKLEDSLTSRFKELNAEIAEARRAAE